MFTVLGRVASKNLWRQNCILLLNYFTQKLDFAGVLQFRTRALKIHRKKKGKNKSKKGKKNRRGQNWGGKDKRVS